jgi:hypothetical protein
MVRDSPPGVALQVLELAVVRPVMEHASTPARCGAPQLEHDWSCTLAVVSKGSLHVIHSTQGIQTSRTKHVNQPQQPLALDLNR